MPDKPPKGWKDRFLTVLGSTGILRVALEAAGITRSYALKVKKKDRRFAEQWDEVFEDAVDLLEMEAWSRGRATSDALLMFLLRANRPQKYRDLHTHEVSGPGGAPIGLSLPELWSQKTVDAERERKTKLLEQWRAPGGSAEKGQAKGKPPERT